MPQTDHRSGCGLDREPRVRFTESERKMNAEAKDAYRRRRRAGSDGGGRPAVDGEKRGSFSARGASITGERDAVG